MLESFGDLKLSGKNDPWNWFIDGCKNDPEKKLTTTHSLSKPQNEY
jgi:hypothetical protein